MCIVPRLFISLVVIDPLQNGHALNMPCLGEEVEAPQAFDPISHSWHSLSIPYTTSTIIIYLNLFLLPLLPLQPPPLPPPAPNQNPDIPRLRMHITTHIHHPLGPKPQQLSQKAVIAALSRRINHHHALITLIVVPRFRFGENVGGVAGREGGVGDGVLGGVEGGGGDGGGGDVDAEGGGEEWGEGYGEEARAGVGVYEVFDWFWGFAGGVVGGEGGGGGGLRGEDVGADVGGEGFEDGVVVLEEGAGGVEEGVGADVLGCGGVLVGDVGFGCCG